MSPPDIFFLPRRDGTPWAADSCFLTVGRLLALSQRVESHCRVLALQIDMRSAHPSPFESEQTLHAFCDRMWGERLHNHIRYIVRVCGSDADLYKVLNEARVARNEVAHQVTLGFEHWAYDETLSAGECARIRELATSLAHADHLLCTLESLLSHKAMPSADAYRTYVERLVNWVCNTDNGDSW